MRYWIHTNKRVFARVHDIVIQSIHRYYRETAIGQGIADPDPGTISFTQRWGSAANLNPHLHILSIDGVYQRWEGKPRFRNLPEITDADVAGILESISRKGMAHIRRRGYLKHSGEVVENPDADAMFKEHDSIALATACSLAGKIAFGPNAGKSVTRIGSGFGYGEEVPLVKDGNVKLRLKSKWTDGTTHLRFTPGEFLEKLAALIPPPRAHLVRWAGVFAPNSPYRRGITLRPDVKKVFQSIDDGSDPKLAKNHSWSMMLARVLRYASCFAPCGPH